jgi:hypothetical protein
MVIWYIFPRFVMLYQEKSGNPALKISYVKSYFGAQSAKE